MDTPKQQNAKTMLEIVEHSSSIALRLGPAGNGWPVLYVSGNVGRLGYSPTDLTGGRLGWADIIHPQDKPWLLQAMQGHEAGEEGQFSTCFRLAQADGDSHWVCAAATLVRDAAGSLLYTDCLLSDYQQVMEQRQQEQANLHQQQVLNGILRDMHSGDGEQTLALILGRAGTHLGLSRVALYENDPHGGTGHMVAEWLAEGVPSLLVQAGGAVNYGEELPEVHRALRESGQHLTPKGQLPPGCKALFEAHGVQAAATFTVQLEGGEPYGMLCFHDCGNPRSWPAESLVFMQNIAGLVTTALIRRATEESMTRMADLDQLTGLNNRFSFDVIMEQAIEEARQRGCGGHVLFIDMDDFKVINEGYGHNYGDALLVAVASHLQENYGEKARLFRFGGDEFTILVEDAQPGAAEAMVNELLDRSRHPWNVMDREFYCTISVGVVAYPEGSATVTEVVKNGDIALYMAKNGGKNKFMVYKSSMENTNQRRVETERRMRESIDDSFCGFEVFYQPMVDINGEVVSAEALVRWRDKEGNLLPPGEFIPLAEYLGLIVPLGEFVLREAAHVCRRINQVFPRFRVNVNVSIRQFQQPDFLQRVESILRESGVDLSNMVLEVTEGMVVQDLEHMEIMISELRGLGLLIAMDDFGTGYSSLNNMRRLPLDVIKIDRSFIRDVTTDAYAKSFIRMITDLGHSMGREICVEGVETAAQYGYCADCGVDTIQGFYFHRPMPVEDFMAVVLGATGRQATS